MIEFEQNRTHCEDFVSESEERFEDEAVYGSCEAHCYALWSVRLENLY